MGRSDEVYQPPHRNRLLQADEYARLRDHVRPPEETSPASGKQMYTTYCAVCHGADGRGNGPAATALKVHPTDLVQLAKDNGGKFPGSHVYAVLQFGTETTAHGSKDMPVWGPALRSLDRGSPAPDMQEHQRIANLTNYLKTLQQ